MFYRRLVDTHGRYHEHTRASRSLSGTIPRTHYIRKGYPIEGSTRSNKTQHERRQPVSFVLILTEASRKQGVSTVYVKGTLPGVGGGGSSDLIANKLQTRKRCKMVKTKQKTNKTLEDKIVTNVRQKRPHPKKQSETVCRSWGSLLYLSLIHI